MRKGWSLRIHAAAAVLCLAFLAFLAGIATVEYELPPYAFVRRAYHGARAQFLRLTLFRLGRVDRRRKVLLRSNLWRELRTDRSGVTRHEPEAAFEGLTLYTSSHRQAAWLIDMRGNEVHRWSKSLHEIWPDPPHLDPGDIVDDQLIYWRRARLFPNGDILAIVIGGGITPWGYGLFKLDKDSNLLWAYAGRAHHDFDIHPDGRVAVLTHAIRTTPVPAAPHLPPPILEDFVDLLTPRGEALKRISLVDAMAGSHLSRLLNHAYLGHARDPLHANTVAFVPSDFARRLNLPPGDYAMVLLRDIDTLAILDLAAGRIVWALPTVFARPHDVDFLDDGSLMTFDNLGLNGPGGRSRVVQFDPLSLQFRWAYAGTAADPFDCKTRGSQQRLPNGNTLITETDGARLLEVTPGGRIVWEFRNPPRLEAGRREAVAVVCGGLRYRRSDLPFLADGHDGAAPPEFNGQAAESNASRRSSNGPDRR